MVDKDNKGRPNGGEAADSAATYIAAIAQELAQLARRNNLNALGYILEMAWLEADQIAKR